MKRVSSETIFFPNSMNLKKQLLVLNIPKLVLLFACVFLVSCKNVPDSVENGEGSAKPASLQDPLAQNALIFEKTLSKEASPSEIEETKTLCSNKTTAHPYCPLQKYMRLLQKKYEAKMNKPRSYVIKTVTAPTLEIHGNKIRNWKQVRKLKVAEILLALNDLSIETLSNLSPWVLKQGCPNTFATALAATLENFIPNHPVYENIALLFEKGGRCAPVRSTEREQLLTRAALFHYLLKDYSKATKILATITPQDAFSGRSLYWLSKIYKIQNQTAKFEKTLNRLKKLHPLSFHAILATLEGKEDPYQLLVQTQSEPLSSTYRSQKYGEANSWIAAVENLKQYQRNETASFLIETMFERFPRLEFNTRFYLLGLAEPNLQVRYAPEILLRSRDRRTRELFELAYPRAFYEAIEKHAQSVDPLLLLAIARRESSLDPFAVSPANAQGLLQVHPNTAKTLHANVEDKLFDINVNIDLSSRYIKELKSIMKDQLPLVLAAYNAGEQPVSRWVNRYPTPDMILFMDLIPYRETREYVGHILANYYFYHKLYSTDIGENIRNLTQTQLAKVDVIKNARTIKAVEPEVNETVSDPEFQPIIPNEDTAPDSDYSIENPLFFRP